jgi:alkylmercury lyase
MLQAALPVRRAAFRLLLRGQPASIDDLAAVTGLSDPSLRLAVDDVASVGMAERMDDTVIGMDGLSTRPTRHSVTLDGVKLWTWCAYDIVGIAAALGIDAQGRTRCGHCDRSLEVEVRAGEPKDTNIVGWLPSEACSNVMAEFCPSALFFCSLEHLRDWLATSDRREGEASGLIALAERGREEWAELVSSPSRRVRTSRNWSFVGDPDGPSGVR